MPFFHIFSPLGGPRQREVRKQLLCASLTDWVKPQQLLVEVSVILTEWNPMGSLCKEEILSKLKSVATDIKAENASALLDHHILDLLEEKFPIRFSSNEIQGF